MAVPLFALSTPSVAMAGEDAVYPVRRIFCVGRNYADHAREMGSDPTREPPFYFTKPADALVADGIVPYPPGTANLHHEIELVVALGAPVFQATPEQAAGAVFAYGVGLDMTRRDLQNAAKDKGRPWCLGKAFEFSAPLSPLVRAEGQVLTSGAIGLDVNGQPRQRGDLSQMIWSIPEIIVHLSSYYHLGQGDLIFTGTPGGVGPVVPGDRLSGWIEGVGELAVQIAPPG